MTNPSNMKAILMLQDDKGRHVFLKNATVQPKHPCPNGAETEVQITLKGTYFHYTSLNDHPDLLNVEAVVAELQKLAEL